LQDRFRISWKALTSLKIYKQDTVHTLHRLSIPPDLAKNVQALVNRGEVVLFPGYLEFLREPSMESENIAP
jgi:hypothetical protein